LTLSIPERQKTVRIFTGADAAAFVRETLPGLFPGNKALFVLDGALHARYPALVPEFAGGKTVHTFSLPGGERFKTFATAGRIVAECARRRFERIDAIAAIGGGRTSDIAGFAASIYQRGIPFFIIPTTLLSMVDACVGGKTAVNLPEGKNLAGTFHQPAAVAMDFAFLDTLPRRQVRTGMAEVIKHGVIGNPELFAFLETAPPYRNEDYPRFVEESVLFKKRVVEADEREGGIREILNFGHTMGHAIEINHYARFSHGEAVAIGMEWESFLGGKMGVTPATVRERIRAVLARYGFPRGRDGIDIERVAASLQLDKKNRHGKIRAVLPEAIGAVTAGREIDVGLVRSTWKEFCDEK